ncbi:hypothetical protein P8452_61563 [Trifolium repens]|nr:hypothetical protein P8452_61563 [Trifolium repens]
MIYMTFFQVAALVPKCELGQLGVAMEQDLHSLDLVPKAFRVRGRMEEVTCGGNALRFYAAVRLRLSRMGLIKTEDKTFSIEYQIWKRLLPRTRGQ